MILTIILTSILTLSVSFAIFSLALARQKKLSWEVKGKFQQIEKELESTKQEKSFDQEKFQSKIDELQNQIQNFEIQNELLKQEKDQLETEKNEWSKDKEAMLYKLSEEIIKKSHEQQLKMSEAQKEAVKKVTEDLFKNFQNVTSKVASLNDQMQESAKTINLTKQALLSPSGAGRSAEITLENVLKNSGLKEKSAMNSVGDYILQSHFSGENINSSRRPDAILFFTNDQIVVIDSKSSSHFLELEQVRKRKDKEQEKLILSKIKETFRKHLESLTKKDYSKFLYEDLLNKNFSDHKIMIVMFLQTEKILETIREIDPHFEEKAMEKGIIVASPIGLINFLSQARIVLDRIKQEKNIEFLKIEVQKLLDNVTTIFKESGDLGKSLNRSLNVHNKMVKTLNKSVYSSMKKISDLGIEGKKSNHLTLVEEYSNDN